MSIQRHFDEWTASDRDFNKAPHESCSPNLVAVDRFVTSRWGGQDLGCEADRPIRAGTKPSEHSWGAAKDWRYDRLSRAGLAIGRLRAVTEMLPWMIAYSAELHICSIHDYFGDRIWRAGRTTAADPNLWWKKQFGAGEGMGESWATYFHYVTTIAGFGDATPIEKRAGIRLPGSPTPTPVPPTPTAPVPPVLSVPIPNTPPFIDRFATVDRVRWLQRVCNDLASWIGLGTKLVEDGKFGALTLAAVVKLQRKLGVPQDGVFGDVTRIALAKALGAE